MVLDSKLFEEDPEGFIADKRVQMGEAVEALDFETAAILRDEIYRLEGKIVPEAPSKNPVRKKKNGKWVVIE
jgi:protein-arginine kinase activator protein McsA